MNKLPNELFHKILIQVPFEDRMKCTLVCRYWYHSLHTGSLFYEVTIKDTKTFDKFIDMLKSQPSKALQVEILKHDDLKPFDKRKLCNMLSNLRVIEYIYHSFTSPCTTLCSQPFELVQPNSKLEIVVEYGECELSRHLLKFGSFTRLKHLELMIIQIDDPRKELFARLKSAPVLESLTLIFGKIGITDIEVIHENSLALKTLNLDSMTLVASEFPNNIIPATSVTALRLNMVEVEDNPVYLDLYKYVAKKYTNLENFDYYDRTIWDFDFLKSMKVYRDGLLPFFRKFGATLPHYCFKNIPAELNPFVTLDDLGIKIQKLYLRNNGDGSIFEQLTRSNLSKQVEALNLQHTVIDSPIMLQHFISLKEIFITTIKINLTDYFNALPSTLTSFTARLHDAEMTKLPSHPNSIEYFSLCSEMIYPDLGEAISTCFPKLNELYLQGGVTENLSIKLPDNHFKNINIQADYNGESSHVFSIKNTNCAHPQYFIANEQNKDTITATAEELQDRVIISLNYDTVDFLHYISLKSISLK